MVWALDGPGFLEAIAASEAKAGSVEAELLARMLGGGLIHAVFCSHLEAQVLLEG